MIYNFPTVTAGIDIDSDTLSILAAHPNIVGTKLSCCNIGKLYRLTSTFPSSSETQKEFIVFPGASDVMIPALLVGGAGVIGASVNAFPKVHRRLYDLWKEVEEDKEKNHNREKEQEKMKEVYRLQTLISHGDWAVKKIGGVGGLKAVISKEFGYGQGRVRGPLRPAEQEKVDVLLQTKFAELIELEKSL